MIPANAASTVVDDDRPLPLEQLKDCVSAETYTWLQNVEGEEAAWLAQLEEESAGVADLFSATNDNASCDQEHDRRVKTWTSSTTNPNGTGGYDAEEDIDEVNNDFDNGNDDVSIHVQYILSSASGGHGDHIWAAARHLANVLANADSCRSLLCNNHEYNGSGSVGITCQSFTTTTTQHPLVGRSFVELGAGGGIPSWTALHAGARVVVCTDQAIPHRIRCLAESAQRNVHQLEKINRHNPGKVYVVPYQWGSSVDTVTQCLPPMTSTSGDADSNKVDLPLLFDVVVAADCLYMPGCHDVLLTSIHQLLSPQTGVALLPFCLHGNTPDHDVWAIAQRAQSPPYSFHVETLPPVQLVPQSRNMPAKRGLVHMLKLTGTKSTSSSAPIEHQS